MAGKDSPCFYHIDEKMIDSRMSALEAYLGMTSYNPFILRAAFKVRDWICSVFQLNSIGGFSVQPQSHPIEVGGKLDFFDVQKLCDDELILSSSDKHLIVTVTLRLTKVKINSLRKLSIITSVKTHNVLGQLYMLPVRPVHGIIVRKMLNKIK